MKLKQGKEFLDVTVDGTLGIVYVGDKSFKGTGQVARILCDVILKDRSISIHRDDGKEFKVNKSNPSILQREIQDLILSEMREFRQLHNIPERKKNV